jgi:hypothetical protein
MDAAQARARLNGLLSGEPALDSNMIDALLEDYLRSDGIYDLNAAASEGWYHKAALVSGDYDLSLDGEGLSRSQVYTHCIELAKNYAKRALPSVGRFKRSDVVA